MNLDEISYRRSGGVLPPYVQPHEILLDCLPTLAPPERITPSEALSKYRMIDGAPASLDRAPYMAEPLDMTASRRYRGVVLVGPARTGKTFALVEGTIVHRWCCDPCSMQVTQMDQLSAKRFTQKKLDPMLRASPEMRARLISRAGTLGNMYDKQFRGDGFLGIGWPSTSQFASQDIQVTISTDFDHVPDDVDGEGDLWNLMLKRGQTFGSRAMTIAESSPRRDVQDEGWAPATRHEPPPATGIIALYGQGTRARYYWRCPHCDHEFEPGFGDLKWPDSEDIEEAAAGVYMLCPSGNGCVLEPARKYEMNGAGRWLHESADGKACVEIGDEAVRRSSIVSYWIKGPHASDQSWQDLTRLHLIAEREYERIGAEGKLRTFWNTSLGLPYLPRSRAGDIDLGAQRLMDRAEYRELGILPAATRFVTVQVDVQGSRFVASAEAWGEGLEHWLVDRWDIVSPPADAPGATGEDGKSKRSVVPWRYEEDWETLAGLHERVWPVEGASWGLKPAIVIIDSQGVPGTYEKALRFWRKRRAAGLDRVYHLYKGDGRPDIPRAKKRKPEAQHTKKWQRRNDVDLVFVNVNKIKDEVAASLMRDAAGPLAYHLPQTLPREQFEEYCAERREEFGWVKKQPHLRNESLDLAVFAKAAVIVKGAEGIRDWSNPPAWAAAGPDNSNAVSLTAGGQPAAKPATANRPSLAELMKQLNG